MLSNVSIFKTILRFEIFIFVDSAMKYGDKRFKSTVLKEMVPQFYDKIIVYIFIKIKGKLDNSKQ